MHKTIQKADAFALFHHNSQFRRYTNEPYIVHPRAVSYTVMTVGGSMEAQAAAKLHDVIEDCDVTIKQIEAEFGSHIADYVLQITDAAKPEDGNRKVRNDINVKHLAKACASVKTIKLADINDNAPSIFKHDKNFWKVWSAEKKLVLPYLIEGNRYLFNKVTKLLDQE